MKKQFNLSQPLDQLMILFLLISPILDLLTSLSIHFTGHSMIFILVLKMLFLGFLFFQVIKRKELRRWLWYYGFLFLYFIFFLLFTWKQKDFSSLLMEIQGLFRTFYFPIMLSTVALLSSSGSLALKKKWLAIVLLEYLVLIFLPILTKTGFDSYAYSKTGTIGWFYSTNEISGIFAILGPIFLMHWKDRSLKVHILLLILYVFILFSMGTKVPILAFFLTIFVFFIVWFTRISKEKRRKSYFLAIPCSILIIGTCIYCLPKTSFYRNIQIHLDFLEIRSAQDLLTFDHIDHFIFSERLTFLLRTKENYDQSSITEKWIGMGTIEWYGTDQVNTKAIEMDYYDIFYHYGILGTILFFFPFIMVPFWKQTYSLDQIMSLLFIFVLAFFSGHILVAPSVAFLAVWVLYSKEGSHESCLHDHSLQ